MPRAFPTDNLVRPEQMTHRVTPPRITAPATAPLQTRSHRPTACSAAFEGRGTAAFPDCKATSVTVPYCPGLRGCLLPKLQPHWGTNKKIITKESGKDCYPLSTSICLEKRASQTLHFHSSHNGWRLSLNWTTRALFPGFLSPLSL